MKKISAIFMSVMLAFSLTACADGGSSNSGSSNDRGENSTTQNSQSTSSQESEISSNSTGNGSSDNSENSAVPNIPEDPKPAVEGKTLVVYYSASGNTEKIAQYIASETGGNTFELIPVNEYSSADLDWTNRSSRVCKEHDDPSLRKIELKSVTVPDWNSYDTVFIGYPIWWQIAAWPTNSFVESNDFTGKTVIPFCTSTSSGFGESGKLLKEAAGTGNWLDGQRFQSRASEDSVRSWVKGLNL